MTASDFFNGPRVHWMRNALAHAPTKQRAAVAAVLKTIFAQETKTEAAAQWDAVADALRDKQPKLGALMDAFGEDVLAYWTFPRSIGRRSPRPTPSSGSTARSSDVIAIFPNDAAIIRLVGAPMLETNDEWAVARRYMSLETLARVTDTQPSSCPEWPPDQLRASPRTGAPTP